MEICAEGLNLTIPGGLVVVVGSLLAGVWKRLFLRGFRQQKSLPVSRKARDDYH